ncbi:MAG: hypothetical protein L6R42_000116 [Xanthoria sp. 1 TBL-2021]|nr:MAG: hypothetical protein L6R42_000116 [Xanthoria sp. 1 TBL-2021]
MDELTLPSAGIQFAGVGRHAVTLPPDKITALLKAYYAIAVLHTTALATAKLSILYLFHRIFETRAFQITIRVLAATIILWWVSVTAADVFICSPIRSNWEPTIPKHCGNLRTLLIAAGVPWILTDFAILAAPLFIIKDLQMKVKDKIGLFALFLSGGM